MAKYKLVYENDRVIKGSVSGKVEKTDKDIIDLKPLKEEGFKLVYEAAGDIKASTSGVVAEDDEVIIARAALEGEVETEEPVVEEPVEEVGEGDEEIIDGE